MSFGRYPRVREEWGSCSICGFDVPVSKLRFHPKWGWECTGPPGANCWDGVVDHDIQMSRRRFRVMEGTRRSRSPTIDPNEGV